MNIFKDKLMDISISEFRMIGPKSGKSGKPILQKLAERF